ncbi:hypothetical protein ELI_3630 [Eubacterium callanderi]|uniref:Uncharacterized protein n=1 Tax=Eubacterium callanderi TaxID=53442 RepID=E3GG46_9FIRM|nr:hypothetical protein ELI_3630 [Eubacterium callanderi]
MKSTLFIVKYMKKASFRMPFSYIYLEE